jgi:hypothetical protein
VDNANAQYDPVKLTHDVFRLLLDKGLPVDREAGDFDAAVDGAGQILRWLGVEPVTSEQNASYRQLDLDGQLAYNRRVHGD